MIADMGWYHQLVKPMDQVSESEGAGTAVTPQQEGLLNRHCRVAEYVALEPEEITRRKLTRLKQLSRSMTPKLITVDLRGAMSSPVQLQKTLFLEELKLHAHQDLLYKSIELPTKCGNRAEVLITITNEVLHNLRKWTLQTIKFEQMAG